MIEAAEPDVADPRLVQYVQSCNPTSTARSLNLIDNFLKAIGHAERFNWESVVIVEDDIIFRHDFGNRWSEVESEVRDSEWGVLTLHRTPMDGRYLMPESILKRTSLVPVFHNVATQCVIVRQKCYQLFKDSLQTCITRGYPVDFFYGIFASVNEKCLYATDRNLSGQAKIFASTVAAAPASMVNFYSQFRSAPWPLCPLFDTAYRIYKILK